MDEDPRATEPQPPARRPSGAPEIPEVLRERPEDRPGEPSGRRRSSPSTTIASLNVALNFVYAVVGLLLLGLLADWLLGTSPTLTVIGAVLGVIGGGYRFIRQGMALGGPPRR